ncbi:MAG: electron transfer flavoprotein subunit beta/FixA family protein [Acidobacteriota bacterium]|nr:electron transfer flavoprotein subunit beta/FixA family protein [Acidobacteriota bacterium]
MRIAVCIKQIPDSEAPLRVDTSGRWIDEEDIPFVINESDEYALEEGLTIAEQTDGEVVVFTLGPERAREALRKALALGAARAVHLVDTAFAGGDAMATSRALAAAIGGEAFDLVLTGSQSDDTGFAATGSMLAGHLGWPHAWLVMGLDVDVESRRARVVREMESGVNEIFNLTLPAVIQVQAGINRPRYASLKGIMQAKRKEITEISPSTLALDAGVVGVSGSAIEVVSVFFPESGGGAQIIQGEPAEAARQLVEKLQKEARVL